MLAFSCETVYNRHCSRSSEESRPRRQRRAGHSLQLREGSQAVRDGLDDRPHYDLECGSGLEPYLLSFHPGSQQRDVGQWSSALTTAGLLFRSIREEIHVDLKMINMGEGFPANYLEPADPLGDYAENIIEPGRSLTADAGVIASEIVNLAKKSVHERYTWVFLDIGKFGGLIETQDEAIKYPIYFEASGKALDTLIAGPTCDSMDILYENYTYKMPQGAKIGDRAYILTTGAYTQSCSSIYFNGFPPLTAYVLK